MLPAPILLVDDNPNNLLVLEALLAAPGVEAVRAGSGEEALRLLAGREFAVVLLDVHMPGLNGFETAQRVRASGRSPETPVIFLTARDESEFPVREAYALGAVDYLTKPVIAEVLQAKVAVFINLYRKTERIRELERRERASAEAGQRIAEERLRLVVESATDFAIVSTDAAGVVTTWNAGAEKLFGWGEADALGRPFEVLFTAEDRAAGVPARQLAAAAEQGRVAEERWLLRRDGTRFFASGVVTPIRGDTLLGFTAVARDETARRRSEEEAARLLDTLREADRRKDEFLATLAHELRNPLAPIRMSLEIMRLGGGLPAGAVKARDVIERQTDLMTRLVDDLLDVSRISRGKVDLRRERVDVRDFVQAAVETNQPLLTACRHELTVAVPDLPTPTVGDRYRLTQVVSNLLHNAIKYTPPGGRVRLSVERDGGAAVVRVADSGVGIRPDYLGRVFDLFVQIEGHDGRLAQSGLGIGLALVKRLVEMHGGSVAAHSEGPGRGSEFVVRLPLAD